MMRQWVFLLGACAVAGCLGLPVMEPSAGSRAGATAVTVLFSAGTPPIESGVVASWVELRVETSEGERDVYLPYMREGQPVPSVGSNCLMTAREHIIAGPTGRGRIDGVVALVPTSFRC